MMLPTKYPILLLTVLFCGWFQQLFAQNKELFTLKGQLIDAQQATIEVGNVLVLSASDSSLLKGTYILDGVFELEGLEDARFLLQMTALGYQDTTFLVENAPFQAVLDLGTIALATNNTLKTVTVESTVPTFKSERGKIIVNVERSMLSASGSALDVLRRSPKVLVNSQDQVQVFGKGAPILLLDGQPVTEQELKNIPSSEIKEVEIIKNPSAKYDAAGRAVINIITRNQNLEGYNGQAFLNLGVGRFYTGMANLSLNYRKKKWSIGGSYAFRYRKTWNSNSYLRAYLNGLDTIRMNNHIETLPTSPQQHFYRLKVGYQIDSSSQIGLQYRGAYRQRLYEVNNVNTITENNAPLNTITARSNGNNRMFNNSLNLNYTKDIDTLGSNIFAAAQYSQYSVNSLDEINQTQVEPQGTTVDDFRNGSLSNIHLVNAQVDYVKGFKGGIQLEMGLRNAFVSNQSNISFTERLASGEWETDPNLSNGYAYEENVAAAYAQANWEKGKWFFEAGVRAEWALLQGRSPNTQQTLLERNYWHVFPNATISYDILEDLETSLSYTTSINRPDFDDLNPFVDFIDQYSVVVGNPYLIPAYNHSAEWALTYLEMASLEVEFTRTYNQVDMFIDKKGDNFNITTRNYDQVDQWNISLNLPYENKWWTTYNAFGFSYTQLQYDRGDAVLNYSRPMFYAYSYNAFRIPKIVNLEVTFQYVSGGAEGYFEFKPFYTLGASLERKFLDDKLSVRLSFDDILYSYVERGNALVTAFDIDYTNLYDTRYVRLALRYNFGELKAPGLKDRSVNKAEMQRIN